jgi:hypothetical protein
LRSSSTRAIVGIDASQHVSPRRQPGIPSPTLPRGRKCDDKSQKMTYLERFSLDDAQKNCLD